MDNFQNDTYQNTGYRVDRQDYHIITLDSKSVSSAARAANFLHNDVYYKLNDSCKMDTPPFKLIDVICLTYPLQIPYQGDFT